MTFSRCGPCQRSTATSAFHTPTPASLPPAPPSPAPPQVRAFEQMWALQALQLDPSSQPAYRASSKALQYLKIGAATLGGGALLAVTGGLAAPAIAAGLGAAVTLLHGGAAAAAAVSAAAGSAGGIAATTSECWGVGSWVHACPADKCLRYFSKLEHRRSLGLRFLWLREVLQYLKIVKSLRVSAGVGVGAPTMVASTGLIYMRQCRQSCLCLPVPFK